MSRPISSTRVSTRWSRLFTCVNWLFTCVNWMLMLRNMNPIIRPRIVMIPTALATIDVTMVVVVLASIIRSYPYPAHAGMDPEMNRLPAD